MALFCVERCHKGCSGHLGINQRGIDLGGLTCCLDRILGAGAHAIDELGDQSPGSGILLNDRRLLLEATDAERLTLLKQKAAIRAQAVAFC